MDSGKAENFAKTIRLEERLRERQAGPSASTASSIGPGSRVGNYLIVKRLGEGGMGVVFQAIDTALDRTVALKVLPPHLVKNPDFLQRIRTEAHAQARLHHPNIVTLYSVFEVPAGFVLVMEFVEGQTLQQRIQAQGPLDPAEAIGIFEKVLQGIAYAHQMNIVHRDLKPDNIFITQKGEVKIMDFGVAHIADNKDTTNSRSMVGTLLYIAPEQVNGRMADVRSDIYTIGISLFEAVTGRLPFERRTDYALMHAHVLESPPSPRNLNRDLPHGLEKAILKAIEKDPARRYQTAPEFRNNLLRQGRRHGIKVSAPTEGADRWQLLRDRFNLLNGVFGGFTVDLTLIGAAIALGLFLGFYPGQERPHDEVEPITRLTPKHPPLSDSTPVRTSSEHNEPHVSPHNERPTPPRDRYDSLRKAWGG